MEHTKEPWKVSYECEWVVEHDRYSSYTWAGIDARGETVALAVSHRSYDLMEANARRIVACVNACAGISTENLESNKPVLWLARTHNSLLKEREDLLAALGDMLMLEDTQRDLGHIVVALQRLKAQVSVTVAEGK